MSIRHLFVAAFAVGLSASSALAQEVEGMPAADPTVDAGTYPVRFTLRPITLPEMTLRGELGFNIFRFDFGVGADQTFTSLGVGGAFGITDDLEVGLGQSPVAPALAQSFGSPALRGFGGILSPEGARGFLGPQFYGRYRFVAQDAVEVGAELGLLLPTENSDFGLSLGVPVRVRASDSFALDASLGFFMSFGEDFMGDRDMLYGLSLLVMPRFAMDFFYAGLDTGFFMDLENPDSTFIPLLFEVGGTFPVSEMVLDVYVGGGMPYFLFLGSDDDKVFTEIWQFQLGARIYIGLGSRDAQ